MKKIFIILLLAFGLIGNCFASFPTTQVLDNFTRANSTTTLGTNWTIDSEYNDPMGIISNTTYQPTDVNTSIAYWNVSTFNGVMEVYDTISTQGTTSFVCLFTDTSSRNGYCAGFHTDYTQMDLSLESNFTPTILINTTLTSSAGDSQGLTWAPNGTLTIWYKPSGGVWVSEGTVNDTTFVPKYLAIYVQDINVRISNFGGGVANPTVSVNSYKANWYNANQY